MKWTAYNEHDELVRAVDQIDHLEPLAQAAQEYVHAILASHHGMLKKGTVADRLKELSQAVMEYDCWEQDA